ncbi:serine hydrolase domain-containing protein [Hydrogenophaga sp. PAMC20947]|uniref:serine hydrolase domain-containing protein n=1 Tax=Hydrogenophaga sp. PAMC20947 TaxID=2565558 RepID=UPI00109DBD25|nr:serine hydrolase domain-containing protein [Hydrogenophaga sp. PAMC20947]QCB44679.1 class A beta-lactamase-related serine hydrolase [Hydrogenophaga sp. PAMC20947]
MTSTTDLPTADPTDLGLCPDRTRRLISVLRAEVDRGYLPGAVVLLARHGRIALHEAVGQLNPAHDPAMARDAIFRIYSMTKPVVSVAVMMLVEQGRLLLTDPVEKYLPAFAGQQVATEQNGSVELRPAEQAATVQDLLRHTAGLTYEFLGTAHVQQQYAQANIGSRERSNAAFCQALAALPLFHQPGTRWAYSRATDVLGRLIEVLTGQTLGQHLQTAIFAPLGMHDTAFSVPPAKHARIAEPFAHDPDGGIPMRVLDPRKDAALEAGGGGLMSTSSDYARFLQFMLNRGELNGTRLLGTHTVEYMTADHLGSIPSDDPLLPPGHGFGLGFAVRTHAGVSAMPGSVGTYHWGGIAGTTFFVDPAEDFFGILMTQAPNQRDPIRNLFRNLAYATLVD